MHEDVFVFFRFFSLAPSGASFSGAIPYCLTKVTTSVRDYSCLKIDSDDGMSDCCVICTQAPQVVKYGRIGFADKTITACNIIIATGSVPFVPPGIEIDGKCCRL